MKKIHVAIASVLVAIIVIGSIYTANFLINLDGTDTNEPTELEYDTYSNYGFSFKYKKGMVITVPDNDLTGKAADDYSGVVVAQDDYNFLSVTWLTKYSEQTPEIIKIVLDYAWSERDDYNQIGGFVETTKSGHTLTYQKSSWRDNYTTYGIIGIWYCSGESRQYMLMFADLDSQKVQDDFIQYVDWVVCH